MELNYSYNEEAAKQADKQADRITDSGAYVGQFDKVYATTSSEKGTHGIVFESNAPGQGTAEFTLWTHDSDGKALSTSPGYAFLQSLMFFFGLKSLKTDKGTAEVWVDGDKGKRVKEEAEVDIFPDLMGKKIGYVLQKEVTDNGFRMNLYGVFDPTTRKTMTETRDNAAKPVKLDRLLKGLKDKDGRKKRRDAEEPAQPGVGGVDMSD